MEDATHHHRHHNLIQFMVAAAPNGVHHRSLDWEQFSRKERRRRAINCNEINSLGFAVARDLKLNYMHTTDTDIETLNECIVSV